MFCTFTNRCTIIALPMSGTLVTTAQKNKQVTANLVLTNKNTFLRMKINECITSNNGHVWYFNPFQPIAFCHLCLHETTHKKSETRFQ